MKIKVLSTLFLFSTFLYSQIDVKSSEKAREINSVDGIHLNIRQDRSQTKTIKKQNVENALSQANWHSSPLNLMRGKDEVKHMRNANSRTYRNSDESFTAIIAGGPIHYENNGKWEEIETNIQNIGNGQYGYSNTSNIMDSYFGSSSDIGVKTVLKEGEFQEFLQTEMYWEKNGQKINTFPSNSTSATVKSNKLFYKNIYGNITAEFEILTGKRKLTYIIPNNEMINNMPIGADYLVFSEDITLPNGWKYEIKGTQVLLYDNNKNVVTLFHTPRVFEQYEEDNNKPVRENPTEIEVIENGNRITYLLKVKTSWISSTEREYPLGIDPTLSFYPNNEHLWSGFCDSGAFGANDEVWVGYWYGDEIDGFVRFNISGIPAGSTITGATSGLYRFQASGTMNNNRYYVPASSDFDPRHWVAYTILGLFDMWYYYDMYASYTGNVGGLSTSFSAGNSYKTSTFTSSGNNYIQNNLVNGFVNVLFWPNGNSWVNNNYGRFRGYSAIPTQKPYLQVTYNTACTIPSSTTSDRYISNVQFLGTLILILIIHQLIVPQAMEIILLCPLEQSKYQGEE